MTADPSIHTIDTGFQRPDFDAAYLIVENGRAAFVDCGTGLSVPAMLQALADAGLVVNPDGARNQLEGGIVQAVSWTLKEQVKFDERGIASIDWDHYPILKFSEVPEIDADLVEDDGNPSLGVGECTVGPTAAAIGNAVAHALGVRLHDMPLSRERIMSALLK